jgi:thiol-disulfide isomerase/thioredoxin
MPQITRRAALTAAALAPVGLLRPAGANAQESGVGHFGQAPEFTGISNWLNSPPLTMAGLRGKVVLIDFWTYSCINCLRTLPYVTRWYDTYRDKGLVVVGVHTPEFGFERIAANVQTAIKRFGIKYPVAQDNAMATWQAYSNRYWPADYLVNQAGEIVLRQFGEGHYDETENAIRSLLSAGPNVAADNGADLSRIGSPEMYFGSARVDMLASPERPGPGTVTYTVPNSLPPNHFALAGAWTLSPEFATLEADGGGVALSFRSGKVFMVASSPQPVTLGVKVDGNLQPPVTVQESRLYTLYDSADYGSHILTIAIPKAGLQAFSFTFG